MQSGLSRPGLVGLQSVRLRLTVAPMNDLRRLAVALLLVFPLCALAALPAGVKQGPSVEGVTEYSLANGLRVLLFPDATKPTTTVDVTYLVGSRQENYGETGMAHLLEHMLFKGTRSNQSVFGELSRRGMRFNGNTSYDRTTYFETFTSSPESLDWVLRMESERMTGSTFSKPELDSEMTVVRNEYENGENDPESVLWKRMASVAYDWHNYGKATIGARSDIENVPFERLRAYYKMYYQPDNAVLTIAGRFDADTALAQVARYFGALPKPARVLPKLYTTEPVQDGERTVTVRRVASTQFLGALFHTPPGPHPDQVALDLVADIMTVQPSGRLYKALVETHKAAAVDNSTFDQRDAGYVTFFAQVAVGESLDTARDAMLATLYAVKDQPITDAELARVRTKALKVYEDILNDPQRFAVALADASAQGDWRLFFVERDLIRTLKAEDLTRAAVNYFKASNLTLGEFLPESTPDRAPLIVSVDVPAIVKDYKGDAPVAGGESFEPTPANLEARTQRFALPNGLKVVLLPKTTRGGTVRFQLRLDFGDERSLMNTDGPADLTGQMLSRGTQKRDRQAFEDALDALRAKLTFHSGDGSAFGSGQTVHQNLPDLLRLAAEALQAPAFKPEELDQLKRAHLAQLEESRTDPSAVAERAIERQGNPYPRGDVRYVRTVDEEAADIANTDVAAIRAFYDKFYGAAHAEIAIVGDFDPVAMRSLLTELFGDWSNATPYARVPHPYHATTAAVQTFETPDKANAALFGKLALPLNDVTPDFAALLVANRMLGGDFDARLQRRLRIKEGFSYDVGSALEAASIDPNSTLLVYAIFAPQSVAKVRAALKEELARALAQGFTPSEVESARKALLEQRRIARAQDATLAGALVNQAYLGRTWEVSQQLDQAIAKVTPAEANAALRKYLKLDAMVYAYAGDFKAK